MKVHDKNGGLLWSFSGDDRLRFARFSPVGNKIAVTTDLGTLTVLDSDGRQLHERDVKAVAVPCWLPDGGLMLATWMGDVHRLNAKFESVWKRHLQSHNPSKRPVLLAKNQIPTSNMTGWSNAEAKSLPLTPNLLVEGKAYIRFPNVERVVQNDMALLTDGKLDAPAKPWMFPGEVNQWAGLRFHNPLSFEFKTPVRATALTFVEDAAHPASWLRDADIEYWDETSKQWIFLQSILANRAIHTHRFVKPVETTKFRVVLPFGLYGNLRFGELILHGDMLSQ